MRVGEGVSVRGKKCEWEGNRVSLREPICVRERESACDFSFEIPSSPQITRNMTWFRG